MGKQKFVDNVYFTAADYVLLGLTLLVSLGIGVFFAISGRKKTTKVDYLLGGRQMGALPVCLSLFASFQSAISLLGSPAEVYTYGTMVIYSFMGNVVSHIIAAFTVVPLIYPLKLTSVYEYFERRFESRFVRLLATVVGVVSSVCYMTIASLSPALALQTAVGLPLWLSIVTVGAVGTIYTAIGGIKTVIWTDVFQTSIIFIGIIFVLIKGSIDSGGFGKVLETAANNSRIQFDKFSFDPRVRHTFWGLFFGGVTYWMGAHCQQTSIQRIVATKSLTTARAVFFIALPIQILYAIVLLFMGIVIMAYFFIEQCDPLAAGLVTNSNQLMPYFVMHTLSFLPGLPGLYMATIFSGALSTLSSGINSLAANTVEDFLGGVLVNKSEATVTMISKIIVFIYGAGIIGLAYLARAASGPVTQTTYSALSATSGPMFGLFVLSATFPQVNYVGSTCGLLLGLVFSTWLGVGSFLYGTPAPKLHQGSTAMCLADNVTDVQISDNFTSAAWSDTTTYAAWSDTTTSAFTTEMTTRGPGSDEFSMYDLSYTLLPLIGALITVISGLLVTIVTGLLMPKKRVSPSLLFPFAHRIWCSEVETSTESAYKADFGLEMDSKST